MNPLVSAILITVLASVGQSKPANNECVPSSSGFQFVKYCSNPPPGKRQIYVTEMVATQHGHRVTDAIDMRTPLVLNFTIEKYVGPVIKKHQVDNRIFQYVKDSHGKCNWDEIDLNGILDGSSICSMIKRDCSYKDHPTQVTVSIDWEEWLGDAISALTENRYYKFRVMENDGGQTYLNCFEFQGKVKNVE